MHVTEFDPPPWICNDSGNADVRFSANEAAEHVSPPVESARQPADRPFEVRAFLSQ